MTFPMRLVSDFSFSKGASLRIVIPISECAFSFGYPRIVVVGNRKGASDSVFAGFTVNFVCGGFARDRVAILQFCCVCAIVGYSRGRRRRCSLAVCREVCSLRYLLWPRLWH